MNGASWGLLALFLGVLLALAWSLGRWAAGSAPLEAEPGRSRAGRAFYRLCGIDPAQQMGWLQYVLALLVFNALGVAAVYLS